MRQAVITIGNNQLILNKALRSCHLQESISTYYIRVLLMSRVDRAHFHNQVNAPVAKLERVFHVSADSKGIETVKLQN